MTISTIFLILLALQVKHYLADYVFQSGWMVQHKGIYGHPAGLAHAGLHAVMTAVVLIVAPVTLAVALLVSLGEFILHYHMDWAKDAILKRSTVTPKDWYYWVITGLDQFVHQLTLLGVTIAVTLLS